LTSGNKLGIYPRQDGSQRKWLGTEHVGTCRRKENEGYREKLLSLLMKRHGRFDRGSVSVRNQIICEEMLEVTVAATRSKIG